ncbi:MAG: hypothetical protein ACD_13C00024G0002 [uncultured bacterium]|uniref:DNA repair protein RecO n=1 Tax=Candidatus Gottesmanbacteria bacterium GW2011_GWB1_43_11 TaxID=1618446 RepID=A0A0G1CPV3_9BACT|nr:MAG: hypothetical protein ACD_13C00024G0002 [uncultured bacterium]KKS42250.1 MAG: repair protein RecO protein [Candidatus Gottesmanbacteria bacterium GW2011_GWA2_42_16]KKS56310.1 MAG: repair protein RecO protein [Candidatus Gottesmanbacteria bacterium GW2011_GWA1_42_26]KKS82318.1 MAG: repair protein RecO protein [Candidatus Gottesmanbacteria bacterium GW2011_GWC1_43_10]KKS87512.1 MAG: repair protein RecO protein [Candidatus Gottesmanbacteria bacterium GW2011_GWB1_43_11]OGG10329.1 MAG: DNA r
MKVYKALGIVLGRKNIGEADKLVTIFTKHTGKKVVIAKGIRRIHSRRAAHLELFTLASFVIHRGRTFDTVSEVNPISSFSLIRQKLIRVSYVCVALELVERLLPENQEARLVFEHLTYFLQLLNQPETRRNQAKQALLEFKQFLLAELGYIDNAQKLDEARLDHTIESVLEAALKSPNLLTKVEQGL